MLYILSMAGMLHMKRTNEKEQGPSTPFCMVAEAKTFPNQQGEGEETGFL